MVVQVNQLWQPGLRSAGCGTPGNAWRSAGSSSGTSVGSFQSKLSRTHNYKTLTETDLNSQTLTDLYIVLSLLNCSKIIPGGQIPLPLVSTV